MTDFTLGPGPLTPEFEQVKSDIGIVENGNTATHAIPSGYYVIWKGDLYVAKTDISAGNTLSSSNLIARPNGIGNEVNSVTRHFDYALDPTKAVRVIYTSHTPLLISVQRSNGSGRLLLMGGGYGVGGRTRNDFVEVIHSDSYTWGFYPDGTAIEILNKQQNGVAFVEVWSSDNIIFEDISSLTATADTGYELVTETKLNSKLILDSSAGGAKAKTFGALIGNGNIGESELREYYGTSGFYYLNYSTKGTEYGYENGSGNRTVYWNVVREFKYLMPNDTELPTADIVKSAVNNKGSGTYVVTFCRHSDGEARSAMIYTAASNSYGSGILFTYYNSSWYKVKNANNSVSLTAF